MPSPDPKTVTETWSTLRPDTSQKSQLVAAGESADDEEEVADEALAQPEARWIRAHRDQLRALADSFIALDPEKGILVHSADGDEFAAQLKQLSAEERGRVILFRASMYL